jgi:DNA invertase Pin-like site-specific DNA recombinase
LALVAILGAIPQLGGATAIVLAWIIRSLLLPSDGTTSLIMIAGRRSKTVAFVATLALTTFGPLATASGPTVRGATHPAFGTPRGLIDRSQKTAFGSAADTSHSVKFAAAQPVGAAIPPPFPAEMLGENGMAAIALHHLANLAIGARKGTKPEPSLAHEALEVAQWASQSSAAAAIQQMSTRFASGPRASLRLYTLRDAAVTIVERSQKIDRPQRTVSLAARALGAMAGTSHSVKTVKFATVQPASLVPAQPERVGIPGHRCDRTSRRSVLGRLKADGIDFARAKSPSEEQKNRPFPERDDTKRGLFMPGKQIQAIAYLRTSSAANVGADRDSDKRQRAAIASFARAHGYRVVDEFYDAAVSGADPVAERPGFRAMLDRIAGNGVKVILVESPDRFARDLAVQLAGHSYLKGLGVELAPTTAPDFFTEDTPTAVLVRQVLGAISQFEKANLVAKLRAARERKIAAGGRGSGRFTYAMKVPETVALAKQLHGEVMTLRKICAALAERGHVTSGGKPYGPNAVMKMLASD